MQRVLEPEYMDTSAEAEDYAAMDHAGVNRDFVAAFLAVNGGDGLVLDIGTGPADIPILIAQAAPRIHVVAIDAAATMLALAARRIAAAAAAARVSLHRADAKCLPYADACFDAVLSNTILHHIPQPRAFLAQAWRVRKRNGAFLVRDLCRPASTDAAFALVDQHAAGATERQRRLLFDSFCAALTIDEVRDLVRELGMSGASVEMTSDRHYTIAVRR